MKKTIDEARGRQFSGTHLLTAVQLRRYASGLERGFYQSETIAILVCLWQRGFLSCCLALALAALGTISVSAATITQTASDAYGYSSFIGGTNWSNLLPPSSGNDYLVDYTTLYTPFNGSSYTFTGDSLTINGGQFQIVSNGVITVNNLILDNNGTVADNDGTGSAVNGTVQLAGNITLGSDGVGYNTLYGNGTGTMIVTANISGTGGLYPASGGSTIHLQGTNTYTGATTVGCDLYLDSDINLSTNVTIVGAGLFTTSSNMLGDTADLQLQGGQLVLNGNDTVGTYEGFSGSFNDGSGTLTAASMSMVNGTLNGNINAGTLNITNWYYGEFPQDSVNFGNNTSGSTKTVLAAAGQVNINDENLWLNMNSVLTATNVYVGAGANLYVNGDASLGNSNCTITLDGGALFNNGANVGSSIANLTLGAGHTIILTPNGGKISVGWGGSTNAFITINGPIIGSGNLLLDANSGPFTLNGTNTYSGTTFVNYATTIGGSINNSTNVQINGVNLSTTGANKLGDTADVEILTGSLTLGGSDTVGTLSGYGGSVSGATLTATTCSLSAMSVNNNLNVSTLNVNNWQGSYGGQTVVLNNNLTATASTVNITNQTLQILGGSTLTSTNVNVFSSGALQVAGGANLNCVITLNGGTLFNYVTDPMISVGNSIVIGAGGGTFNAGWSTPLTINCPISGTGGVVIANNNGPIVFNGTCASTYLSIQGTLELGADNLLATGATVNLNGGSEVMNMNGHNSTVAALIIDGVTEPNGTWGGTGSGAANISSRFAPGAGILTVGLTTPPNFTPGSVKKLPDGNVSVTASGVVGTPYRLWATTNLAFTPVTNTWTLIQSGTITVSPFTVEDLNATNYPNRFYLFSTP